MKMASPLYSSDREERLAASLRCDAKKTVGKWPPGCWGAANSWLMICGPSPGAADQGQEEWRGGVDCPWNSAVTIGAKSCVFDFDSNKARNARWLMLASAALGSQTAAETLSSVVNLDWGHCADSKTIPEKNLQAGCPRVLKMMKQSQPRVVVTLVGKTWEVLTAFLKEYEISSFQKSKTELLGEAPVVIQIPGVEHRTVILKSPHHPSWNYFTAARAAQIQKAVQWFLRTDS